MRPEIKLFRLWRTFGLFVVRAFSIVVITFIWVESCISQVESDPQIEFASLRSADLNWQRFFDGLSFKSTTHRFRAGELDKTGSVDILFHQLTHDVWRADAVRHRNFGSIVRDSDFWFSVFGEKQNVVEYDRLGFDPGAASSIEGSLFSNIDILSSPSMVLDVALQEFISAPGFQLLQLEKPTRSESHVRCTWEMTPKEGTLFSASYGAFEWVKRPVFGLTRCEFYFGTKAAASNKGSVFDVVYEERLGRFIPTSVVRIQGTLRVETTITTVEPAAADRSFYTPEAFGLKRPAKPWPAWLYWMICAVAACLLGFVVRYWRRRA